MSYHFPIVVGHNRSERIVIVHLTDGTENYQENRVIITNPGDETIPLFKIPREAQLINIAGNAQTVDFENDGNANYLSVTARVNGVAELLTASCNGDFYEYRIPVDVYDDEIDFSFDENQRTYTGKIHIVRPSVCDSVIRINADLGSDATQVNYFDPTSGARGVQEIRIVDELKEVYAPERKYETLTAPKDEPLFLQMEKGNPNFFKTGNITFQQGGNITKGIKESDSFINYLNVSSAGKNANLNKGADTWDKESNFAQKIINIKMLYAHSNMPQVNGAMAYIAYKDGSLNPYGREATFPITNTENLLRVLNSIYNEIIKVSTSAVAQRCKYFSILLLVPNIYSQQNIDMLLYSMNKMNNPANPTAKRYDFRVISESDSAFVGIKEVLTADGRTTILRQFLEGVSDPRQKDVFLIIDAGKGTTDYSIIRYDAEAEGDAGSDMISLKRGGIVGAGGAIDYVFARIFARQVWRHAAELGASIFIDEDTFVNRFMKMIASVPPVLQNTMMLIVETLKKNYWCGERSNDCTTARVFTCFHDNIDVINSLGSSQDPDFSKFLSKHAYFAKISNWVWNNERVEVCERDKEEVNWVCETIADTIVNEMIFDDATLPLTNQIDFVIFNGRSFMFRPLKKAFLDAIDKKRGVHSVNNSLLMAGLYRLKKKWNSSSLLSRIDWEKRMNLKEAPVGGYDMKAVSVRFANHDLCVNYNSDLCCMESIDLTEDEFEQSKFWEGFTDTIYHNRHYYIGYNNMSFAPQLPAMGAVHLATPNKTKLICMTMFPVTYYPINFTNDPSVYTAATTGSNTTGNPTGQPSGPTPTPTPTGQPSNGQNTVNPPVDQEEIDLTTPTPTPTGQPSNGQNTVNPPVDQEEIDLTEI